MFSEFLIYGDSTPSRISATLCPFGEDVSDGDQMYCHSISNPIGRASRRPLANLFFRVGEPVKDRFATAFGGAP
jgi:hypothetical protein